ncbi:FAD-dependent oxidoreductase [Parvularcula lutaonensis]|uniref:FAD-dependent oxidoreductase n=1 Tax=Parvularcula lutaonensis TaxID=491923 RepID=A0ABV7MC40_9PROT|nr:FAD-dependent oxidoreductase [Parvularcula lutaonensis]GGY49441.1 hypothetical protein GCM10007148_17470 [Parvularcula lutaonensis]
MAQPASALVIGGGFFGCAIAVALSRHLDRVVLVEREGELLRRASYVNQARVHTGYHYPRSFQTAASSRLNQRRFTELFEEAVDRRFTKLYAIARSGSRVAPAYFRRFCEHLDLPLREASDADRELFDPRLIAEVYQCEEFAFDANVLRKRMTQELDESGVVTITGAEVLGVTQGADRMAHVRYAGAAGEDEISADWVFNTTYANLNAIRGLSIGSATLRHQLTEVCLTQVPESVAGLGITVMDGPFFSVMPFPAAGRHSLTHVRYTPHTTWIERSCEDPSPDGMIAQCRPATRFEWMRADARRYMPALAGLRHDRSLFEIKTTLQDSARDDGRPIAFRRVGADGRLISILGGKIDNIFDILDVIDQMFESEGVIG